MSARFSRRVHGLDLTREIARGINQIAAVGQHVIAVQIGVAGLGAGFEMRGLGNRAAAQHTHAQTTVFLGGHGQAPVVKRYSWTTAPRLWRIAVSVCAQQHGGGPTA
jgi:murein DD-endopeptidase MepM/ murein hydrolase activator NlpD